MINGLRLRHYAREVRNAITYPGPRPDYHREVYLRHRGEWPLLWKKIDDLMVALAKDDASESSVHRDNFLELARRQLPDADIDTIERFVDDMIDLTDRHVEQMLKDRIEKEWNEHPPRE